MRLYPKKLRNIDDLEREKRRLLRECKRMEAEGFLSLEAIFKKAGKEDAGIASLLDFIPVSNPLMGVVMQFVKQRFSKKEHHSNVAAEAPKTNSKRSKNPLKPIALEFIGGYLKWKAIELLYKGARLLIKKRGEKKGRG